jgi:hypothetical protein
MIYQDWREARHGKKNNFIEKAGILKMSAMQTDHVFQKHNSKHRDRFISIVQNIMTDYGISSSNHVSERENILKCHMYRCGKKREPEH